MTTDDFAPDSLGTVVRARDRARRRAKERGLRADDAVLRAVQEQLLERLPLLLLEPERVLDLGCWGAAYLDDIAAVYPQSRVTGLALGSIDVMGTSEAPQNGRWLNRIKGFGRSPAHEILAGNPQELSFSDGQFDLVVSNLCLPFCQNPGEVFAEVSRVLRPGGAFLFCSLGPDTLLEYRQRWAAVDAYPHVSGLIDMHDLGDAMLKAGLADPVLDRSALNVDYRSLAQLENELQVFGLVNTAYGRRKGLMASNVGQSFRDSESGFSVGIELVHGHAWKAEFNSGRNSSNDEYKIPVSELQGSWKRLE